MQPELPPKYYLAHARELFAYLNKQCSHLLANEHQAYLKSFIALDEDAQCLLVRLLTRKHAFIKRSSLNYTEISNIQQAEINLASAGFIAPPQLQDWSQLAPLLTKPELQHALKHAGLLFKASVKKDLLLDAACNSIDTTRLPLTDLQNWYLAKQQQDTIDYLFFLFFGDLRNRFQKFAMRDLGVLKVRQNNGNSVARFSNKEQALSTFTLLKHQRDFKQTPLEVFEPVATYALKSTPTCSAAQQAHDKLLLSLGDYALAHSPERAFALWKKSQDPLATERWVRQAYHHLGKEGLRVELETLRRSEQLRAATRVFIEDFYARKYEGKRTSVFTDTLRATNRVLHIDEAFINDVEEGVIHQYTEQGVSTLFTENKLWGVLFAFALWPVLYRQQQHNEFDRLPAPLLDLRFYQNNRHHIEDLLAELNDRTKSIAKFTKLAAQHYGYPTGLFRWRPDLMDMLIPCLRYAPDNAIANTLRRMAKNIRHTRDGYPDIMVVENNQLRFEEIKAPGDVLRPNQLVSIQRLRKAGFNVNITQVEWATCPNQVYAVVDIETTGSRKGGNAITEVAVVKVKGGEIIDEWSSLINPQRPIPRHITHLTGIDDRMVRNAPIFSDIASTLKHQLGGCIFVAHNVGFDYGFIKAAYQHIGQGFRMPKYCTIRNARKTFPGLPSYSLGNLTKEFDIDLENHHRALADATATAHLLRLIQENNAQTASELNAAIA